MNDVPPPQSYPPPSGDPVVPSGYGAPPGYGQPPPGYVAPPQSYQYLPAPGSTAPPGYLTQDERTWGLLSHLLAIFAGWIGPLIVMLTKGKESAFVRDQAVESLNFQLTVLIATIGGMIVSVVLMIVIIGFFLLFLVMCIPVAALVFEIIAAVAANNGTAYRYPINIRMVK